MGVNETGSTPDASAIFEASSTNKGQLFPRMTTLQRDGIVNPANGLLIYNIDCNSFNYYNGTSWVSMNGTSSLGDPGAISGSTSVCSGATGETYSISAVTGATSYSWTVPTGATITAGQGTTSITVTFGTASGDICVSASNSCYTSDVSCTSIAVSGSSISLSELKAYYKYNEASGNLINEAGNVGSTESLGSSADGTVNGSTYSQTGKIGNAYDFDGNNDYIELGTDKTQWRFLHEPNCKWSVSFWIKPDNVTAETQLLDNERDLGNGGLFIFYSSTNMDLSLRYGFNQIVTAGNVNHSMSVGTWYHWTITYDQTLASDNVKFYRNGTLIGSGTKNNDNNASGDADYTLKMGTRTNLPPPGAKYYDGLFDEMSIWNRVLSDCEIDYLYNTGAGREL